MASAVTLSNAAPGDLIDILGIVLEGVVVEPRQVQVKRTKYWGVNGVSQIVGGRSGRNIHIRVLIYDDSESTPEYDTARKLADYLDYTLNTDSLQLTGTLKIHTVSDHSEFLDCTFDGAEIMPGESIKVDEGGALGGGYFAYCLLHFYQLTDGAPEPPPGP